MKHKGYGIDIGTKNIKIYKEGQEVLVAQKNVLAMKESGEIIAMGDEAFSMCEKTPENIFVTFPMRHGVIADFTKMQEILRSFVTKEIKGGNGAKDVYVAVPTNITEVEKRAFSELIENAKIRAKHIHTVEKPIAAAVGAGLDIKKPGGVMLIDFGADTTEISILSLGGIVVSRLLPIGGNKLDEDIVSLVKKESNVIIGNKTAEESKIRLASATPGAAEEELVVKGRYLVTGLPTTVTLTREFVHRAIADDLKVIMEAIKIILERTPPEISSDIFDHGIYVTGGGSKIHNLDLLIKEQTTLRANLYDHPEDCVIYGLGRIMEEDNFRDLAFSNK